MKAIIYSEYGPPEVAIFSEVQKPSPTENEILMKVVASTVNRTDAGIRSAVYVISRFFSGLLKPKYKILGCEFAGIVVEVGNNVLLFKIGDKVFGYDDEKFGGHAEYLAINENSNIAVIPENIKFSEAAAITEGGHYALCDIRAAKIKAGYDVMVYGATGAIGSAAVQLLKYFSANVTAVCNTKNVELLKSLGADVVIDYQTEDYTKTKQRFDFIFDSVGKISFGKCKPLLKEKGIYISTELGKRGENIFLALITPWLGGKKVLFPIPTINKTDVEFLKDLVTQKKFKPLIDREYKLEEIVEAYKYVESEQKIGNVILRIAEEER